MDLTNKQEPKLVMDLDNNSIELSRTPQGKSQPPCLLPLKKKRETQQPRILWNPQVPSSVASKTLLDEQWIETVDYQLSSSSEVSFKAGTREMNLDSMVESGSKKLSEFQLKKKYSSIWPALKKNFAVLNSVDCTRNYKPTSRTILDFSTMDEIFGSKERAQQVKKVLEAKVTESCQLWNNLYSSSDPEVVKNRSPITEIIPISATCLEEFPHWCPSKDLEGKICESTVVLVLSNYIWVREKLKHTGALHCLPSSFHVSLRLASNSFRFSDAANEVEKENQGFLFDGNSFTLQFGDFMELLVLPDLIERFVPGLLERERKKSQNGESRGVKRKLVYDSPEAAYVACQTQLNHGSLAVEE